MYVIARTLLAFIDTLHHGPPDRMSYPTIGWHDRDGQFWVEGRNRSRGNWWQDEGSRE
jgi:hypothetical protein